MGITDNLKIQHNEILKIIDTFSSHLSAEELSKDSTYIYGLLLELSDYLHFHLVREDNALYPALFRHPDKKISKLAKQYSDEMGGISSAFNEYAAKWPHAASIQERPEDFIADTREIFVTLSARIKKEDTVLYPLLDILP